MKNSKNKKTQLIGYGFKLPSESWASTLDLYRAGGLYPTKEGAMQEISDAKRNGDISKQSRPKLFKITVSIIK